MFPTSRYLRFAKAALPRLFLGVITLGIAMPLYSHWRIGTIYNNLSFGNLKLANGSDMVLLARTQSFRRWPNAYPPGLHSASNAALVSTNLLSTPAMPSSRAKHPGRGFCWRCPATASSRGNAP